MWLLQCVVVLSAALTQHRPAAAVDQLAAGCVTTQEVNCSWRKPATALKKAKTRGGGLGTLGVMF